MIKISLEVTPKQFMAIASLLNADTRPVLDTTTDSPNEKDILAAEVVKATPKPTIAHPIKTSASKPVTAITAGKVIKMPGFGRSQTQIDRFTNDEQNKFEKKTEEQLEKEQRKEERDARKAERDAIAAEKQDEIDRAAKEIAAIKEAGDHEPEPTGDRPAKPWEL